MAFAAKLQKLRADVNAAVDLCNGLGGKAEKAKSAAAPTPLPELLEHVVDACRAHRKRKREADDYGRVGDEEIVALSRHTENYALSPYAKFLWYVPRLVNVVSLAEAVPAEGSGVTLPLDLRTIAARCRGAFYAPARFAAVQLAFSQPRSRILIFRAPPPPPLHAMPKAHSTFPVCRYRSARWHRCVFTPVALTLALRSRSRLARRHHRPRGCARRHHPRPAPARPRGGRAPQHPELPGTANLNCSLPACLTFLTLAMQQVINTVGAVSLRASLNCDAFASSHSSDAHYDKASFVGLAVFCVCSCPCHIFLGLSPPRVHLRSGGRHERASAAVRLHLPFQTHAQI